MVRVTNEVVDFTTDCKRLQVPQHVKEESTVDQMLDDLVGREG